MIKSILLKKVACLAAIALLCAAAKTGTLPQAGANPGGFDERLGADDGAALAILFTANMRGNLETCD